MTSAVPKATTGIEPVERSARQARAFSLQNCTIDGAEALKEGREP